MLVQPQPQPQRKRRAKELLHYVHATLADTQPTSSEYLPALRAAFVGLVRTMPAVAVDGPEDEAKLWLACADVGLMVLDSRAAAPQLDWAWADCADDLVERAVGKGLVLAQKVCGCSL